MFTSTGRVKLLGVCTWLFAVTCSPANLFAQGDTQALTEAIEKHRKGVLVIQAPPDTEVVVEQMRHEFWFGAALANQAFGDSMRPEDRQSYLSTFLTNFNAAVTENALKWHDMEPRRGNV